MDENTRLILEHARQTADWEDQEQASYDLDTLRKEFRERLYADGEAVTEEKNETPPTEEKPD